MTQNLNRTKQCAKCPWRKSTDPRTIPGGYGEDLHQNLKGTISDGSIEEMLRRLSGQEPVRIMACHKSDTNNPDHCVGWLVHQLGEGGNLALRMRMRDCQNIGELQIIGEQHTCFEDTLPKPQ